MCSHVRKMKSSLLVRWRFAVFLDGPPVRLICDENTCISKFKNSRRKKIHRDTLE